MGESRVIYFMVFMPIAGAFLSYLLGRKSKRGRDLLVCAMTVLEFVASVLLLWNSKGAGGNLTVLPEVCGGLSFTADGFRVMYAAIAAFMWMMTSFLSVEYFAHYRNRNRYYLFFLVTLGATEAIFLSADLYTTFIFFEVMSFASYVWVAQDERAETLRAAQTYLAVAVIGGLVMLMGLFLLYCQAGTLQINELYAACQGKNVYPAAICLFVGFGAKAGVFPLHIWLPKAHPVAPAPASALLSGILTKTGIFGILVISCKILFHDEEWGVFVLVIGVITMFLGALLAVFSIDLKRTLACSSVSQIGFIMVGIGMQGLLAEENALAVRGTLLHMVNHSLFKLILFMLAGVIYMNVHKLNLNDIRGFGRKKPLLAFIYLMGALGIGGIPLWSGYVSKTLLHESIVEYMHALEAGTLASVYFLAKDIRLIETVFLLSGGLTVAYMCKLFIAVFVEKNADPGVQEMYDAKKVYMNRMSTAALLISAVLVPLMGIFPYDVMNRMADMGQGFMGLTHAGHEVHYFTWVNLKGSVISVIIGIFVYAVIVRGLMMEKEEDGTKVYANRWLDILDLEMAVYRPLLLRFLPAVFGGICKVLDGMMDRVAKMSVAAGGFVAGFLDGVTDSIVGFLRRTIYKESPEFKELEEGNELTHAMGLFFNGVNRWMDGIVRKEGQSERNFEHLFAVEYERFKENMVFIGRSLSYGLILFCVGLCATLIYLLVSAVR